jgi:hypothetical protein
MLTLEKRIQQWKKWVNRNKQFSTEELEELENHLREEILYLTEHDNIPDQKAFDQALDILGEKGLLDEEFGKIRKSKFDKVKLWAYAQTIVIVGLVMVIAAPYVHLPKKEVSDSLISVKIGEMDQRVDNSPIFKVNSYVTYQKETYFYDEFMNSLYCFKQYSPDFAINLTYKLDAQKFDEEIFDFDSQQILYKKQLVDGYIDIFKNQQLIKTISYPDKIEPDSHSEAIKVIDRNLVVLVRQERKSFHVFEFLENGVDVKFLSSSYTGKDASYLLVCNLDTYQWNRIDLANVALSMDRSVDELAILLESGEIVIFSTQDGKVILKDNWKIKDFSLYLKKNPDTYLTRLRSLLSFNAYYFEEPKMTDKVLAKLKYLFMGNRKYDNNMSLLYSKKGHQAILIDYQNVRYSFLSPNLKNEYTVIPLLDKDIEGVIKINFREEERLVLVKDDNLDPWTKIFNMYLFKDYHSALKILLNGK